MLRLFDLALAVAGLLLASPLLLILTIVGLFDTGAPIFRQTRVGRNRVPFTLLKFRTMRLDTSHVATHLADASAVTAFGKFLRRTKLDELPQLWNVLKGEMSLVGPRPCLFNQDDLIRKREALRVFDARPGLTGLAQLKGIDMSVPEILAETDARMLASLGTGSYFSYIVLTVIGRGAGDRVKDGKG